MCLDRQDLEAAFRDANNFLADRLHEQAMALIQGHPEFERNDASIEEARRKRSFTMQAFIEHIRQHGCKL